MLFRLARQEEQNAILSLYQDAASDPFSTWNEYYPSMQEIEHDIETGNLYLLVEQDTLIGALSVVPENELDERPEWRIRENAAEIARVAIARSHRGKGYAAVMMREILEQLKEEIYFSVHLSVAKKNLPALTTYEKLGFETVGEAQLWGNTYFLMEKTL